VFKSHATTSSGVTYWTQATLAKFLGLPDHPGLPIAHVIFQLAGYIGAFPFPSQAPAILTNDALLRVVVVMTARHTKVLRGSRATWEREIWRAMAVVDRGMATSETKKEDKPVEEHGSLGFDVDIPQDDEDDDDDDDELMLAAFDAMHATDAFKQGEKQDTQHAMVPTDNFLTVIMFLLLIAPLGTQEPLSTYMASLDDDLLQDLRHRAHSILTSFGVERNPGVTYRTFRKVVPFTLPHLFDPLKILFEHFLYPPDFDLSKKNQAHIEHISYTGLQDQNSPPIQSRPSRPLLPNPNGELLTRPILSQISFVLPPSTLFRNLTLLYSGAEDGFSMPTLQNSTFNWQAPTLLLVSGTLLKDPEASNGSRDFAHQLPYRRFKPSASPSETLLYAAYIPVPWKQTHKASFGTKDTILFQLSPQHDVFPTADATSYVYFNRHPSTYTGIGFGSPLAEDNHITSIKSGHIRRNSMIETKIPLGPVSLHMDDSLTYAVFTHDSGGGGTFAPSTLPRSCRLSPLPENTPTSPSTSSGHLTASNIPHLTSSVTSPLKSPIFRSISPSRTGPTTIPLQNWQDIFEIESLEVYGLGGAEVADEQKRAHQFEEREAERRRRINLGTGDIEADRELLRMAGLVGQGQSGGSMR
jgi:hypothetical protein